MHSIMTISSRLSPYIKCLLLNPPSSCFPSLHCSQSSCIESTHSQGIALPFPQLEKTALFHSMHGNQSLCQLQPSLQHKAVRSPQHDTHPLLQHYPLTRTLSLAHSTTLIHSYILALSLPRLQHKMATSPQNHDSDTASRARTAHGSSSPTAQNFSQCHGENVLCC